MAGTSEIYVTELDKARLQNLIACDAESPLADLEHEIERAIEVEPQSITGDVIDCMIAERTRRIRIEKVGYQPKAFGDLHL